MAKFNFYRGSVQIPLIIRPPGGCEGRTSNALAQLIDIGPTLLDFAGAEPLPDARGQSLVGDILNQCAITNDFFVQRNSTTKPSSGPANI